MRGTPAASPVAGDHDADALAGSFVVKSMDEDDSNRIANLLASNSTLLGWVRTSVAFAGLGFVVAKFGVTVGLAKVAGYLGVCLTIVGLLYIVVGYVQFRIIVSRESPPPGALSPSRWPAAMAAFGCLLSCALLTAYLAISATRVHLCLKAITRAASLSPAALVGGIVLGKTFPDRVPASRSR
jgi:uncharacterized membrane protein YidH (DUF202 family)